MYIYVCMYENWLTSIMTSCRDGILLEFWIFLTIGFGVPHPQPYDKSYSHSEF